MNYRSLPKLAAVLAALALLVGGAPLAAQGTGAIRGQVIETATQQPLSGVQVYLQGTTRGTVTDARGNFLIPAVAAGNYTVQAQMIGYSRVEQQVTVTAEQTTQVSFNLSQAAIELDALVVTGTPGATQRRALGNSVSSINAAQITEAAPVSTVAQMLQGRTPGVTVMPTTGVVGAAANIRIRGTASLSGGNNPVYYVDGVRVRGGSQGGFSTSNHQVRETSFLDAINPDDIESIEIIKGPAAATLYGADAANGVIQIITKKGQAGGAQGISWNGRFEMGQNDWHLGMRENYTLCTNTTTELPHVGMTRENRITHANWRGCRDMDPNAPWEQRLLRQTPLADPGVLRKGGVMRYGLSARGGGERFTYFVSGDREDEEGVFWNNNFERISGRANFTIIAHDNLTTDFRVSYSTYDSQQPLNDNASGGWLRNSWRGRPGFWNASSWEDGWAGLGPEVMKQYDNHVKNERWILGTTLDYRPFEWFRNRLTLGFDAGDRTNTSFYEIDTTGRAPWGTATRDGYISYFEPETRDYTVDYSGSINHDFQRLGVSSELTSTFSFGMQYAAMNLRSTQVVGDGLITNSLRLIDATRQQRAFESVTESRSLGFFVQEMLGWKNRLFVTGALRVDDHSAFGANFEKIYYPKVSVAHVISEEPFFNLPMIDNLKLRVAYGHAGNAPAPFAADRVWEGSSAIDMNGAQVSVITPTEYGNPDLRAERGRELELGFDASLFENALGVEFTYYNNTTKDALMRDPVPQSSGFSGTYLRNVGEINNRGMELSLFGSPLRRQNVVWDTRVSFSTNSNKLVSFGDLKRDFIAQGYRGSQRHAEGYPLAAYFARELVRNADGSLFIQANGQPQLDTIYKYIGPSAPTREASLTNTFTIARNVQLYTYMDYKGGHYLFNMSEQTSLRDDLNHRMSNDPTVPLETWLYYRYGDNMPYIERADFIKLREVSLRYTLANDWARKVGAEGMSISLAGRNLAIPWTRYKSGVDPEVNIDGGGAFTRAESNSVPMLRQLVATIDFRF
jgi:TonB-dependent starch-binding outer membrane protein SusC